MFDLERGLALLNAAEIFLEPDEEVPGRFINLNDAFAWACADAEIVYDADVPRVAELFYNYGWCGILYWCSQRGHGRSEFLDVRRMIEFVDYEEWLKRNVQSSTERACKRLVYTLGEL